MSVKHPRTRKFMAQEPGFTIINAMNRLFPAWFDGESWDAWRASSPDGAADHPMLRPSAASVEMTRYDDPLVRFRMLAA